MKSQGEFQNLTQKLQIERPFLKKDHFCSLSENKKVKKKAYSQIDFHLPVYNSVDCVHLGLSHIVYNGCRSFH